MHCVLGVWGGGLARLPLWPSGGDTLWSQGGREGRNRREEGPGSGAALTLSHAVARPNHLPLSLRKTADWLKKPQTPPSGVLPASSPVRLRLSGRWANQTRRWVRFPVGRVLSSACALGPARLCPGPGSGPQNPNARDKGRPRGQHGQSPQEGAGGRLSPLMPCRGRRPGPRRRAEGDLASPVPIYPPGPEGEWRWVPGVAPGCIPAGTLVGLLGISASCARGPAEPLPLPQTSSWQRRGRNWRRAEGWGRGGCAHSGGAVPRGAASVQSITVHLACPENCHLPPSPKVCSPRGQPGLGTGGEGPPAPCPSAASCLWPGSRH